MDHSKRTYQLDEQTLNWRSLNAPCCNSRKLKTVTYEELTSANICFLQALKLVFMKSVCCVLHRLEEQHT
jgi:hypothetical protein